MRFGILALFTFLIYVAGQEPSECEPIKAKVYVDESLPLQQLHTIFNTFTSSLPASTNVNLSIFTGQKIEHAASVTIPDDGGVLKAALVAKLDSIATQGQSKLHNRIGSSDLASDLLSYFRYKKYRRRSEQVFLFVSSATTLDNIPKILLKKKTTVVVFGESASEQWETVASREDHLFVVSKTGNVQNISTAIVSLACSDSHLFCDTDEELKGAACSLCSKYDCGGGGKSLTCKLRCPYYRVNQTTNIPFDDDKSKYRNHDTVNTVFIVISMVIVSPAVAISVMFAYRRSRNGQFVLHHDEDQDVPQRNRDRNIGQKDIEMQILQRRDRHTEGNDQSNRPLIPETVAQQETQVATGGISLTDEELAASLLKNKREEEMNILATGEPAIHDIRKGK